MSEARLDAVGDDRWSLAGDLDFASVPAVWSDLEKALRGSARVTLSLSGAQRANSAGLALLIEALDVARRNGCELRLVDVPADLMDLARMSQCEHLLA